MCSLTISEFGLKFIQCGILSNDSFTTFCFQNFHSLRRSSGILMSEFNPLLHNSWINNMIFTITGGMRHTGSKIELIALKMPFFVSGTTLFETLNLGISVWESQVIPSALSAGNPSQDLNSQPLTTNFRMLYKTTEC